MIKFLQNKAFIYYYTTRTEVLKDLSTSELSLIIFTKVYLIFLIISLSLPLYTPKSISS